MGEAKGEEPERGQWGNKVEFLLACVGYAVGLVPIPDPVKCPVKRQMSWHLTGSGIAHLGNVWRFPYLCYENGGGAFLVPYIISLFLAGLPVFYLELSIGQFSSLGPNMLYGYLAPVFRGIGWAMVLVSFFCSIYYNMIIAWTLYYFAVSIRTSLPWDTCRDHWNTAHCQSNREEDRCHESLGPDSTFFNKVCFLTSNVTMMQEKADFLANNPARSPSEEYFNNFMYDVNSGGPGSTFSDLGGLDLKLVISLIVAWVVIFLCLIKGVQSTGKVVYFTATFPYVVMVILLIRGVTLKGAGEGIKYYLTPTMDKLFAVQTWRQAATQIFYSLGPGFGGLLTMSSYNPFHNNCYRDAIMVAFINCATSVFAGFAIFSTLGFMADDLGRNVSEVVQSGPSLAFIAYPEAIVRMPAAPIWSILFFFMLFTLGLDSQFAMVETITTAFMDQFPVLRKQKWAVILVACVIMFALGLPFCLRGGIYIFTIFENFSASYSLLLIALSEFIAVSYLYEFGGYMGRPLWHTGVRNFMKDLELMLGKKTDCFNTVVGPQGYYWIVTWVFIAPPLVLAIFILSLVNYETSKYNGYVFPDGAEAFGWVLAFIPASVIVIIALVTVIWFKVQGRRNNLSQPLHSLITPAPEWGPAEGREERAMRSKHRVYSVEMAPQPAKAATYSHGDSNDTGGNNVIPISVGRAENGSYSPGQGVRY